MERARRVAGEAVTLDDVEAALWRRGLDAAGVDEVVRLVLRFAARPSFGPEPGAEPAEELGPEPAEEPAGKQAGKQAGEGSGTRGGRARSRRGIGDPLARVSVSTAPDEGVAGEKACPVCGVARPLDEFYRDANKPDGRRGTCKGCERTRKLLRGRELAAVRRLVREGGDPRELLAAIEERLVAERELRAAARLAARVGPDGRRVTPALDAATLAVVLAASG